MCCVGYRWSQWRNVLTALDGLEVHIRAGIPLPDLRLCSFLVEEEKKALLPLLAVEILMDFFSVPLTDEAGSGQHASSRWGHLNLVVAEQSAETLRANAAFTSVGQRESQEVWRL
ncbi:unnamed protein product [Pleuronectes platessa]|uniref:Uncharacterized protein n=1 Tax=Pleuronectes platessa TaxID=8262 RepID=A0A9N7YGZ1_PLEPL|nr:unnamed protein product [Pleuronectes platessa]